MSTVSGVVADAQGRPLANVEVAVWVLDAEGSYEETGAGYSTDGTGAYAIDLPEGIYRFGFFPDDIYRSEFYDDQQAFGDATAVAVSESDQVLAEARLDELPTITGSVKADDGSAVPGSYVVGFRYDPSYGWDFGGVASTEPDGTFSMSVETGLYRLGFFDEDDAIVEEYWQDRPTLQSAKNVTVTAAGVSGIDARVAVRPVPPRPPVLSFAPPRAEGWTAVGQMVKVTDGVWGSTVSLSRQWLRNGVPIPGATGQQYKITAADVGSTLSAQVTATPANSIEAPSTQSASLSGVVRWTTKVAVTAKRGVKKATLTVRVTSAGGAPSGWVTVKLRGKVVGTGKVTKGRATVTIKKLTKTKKRYAVHYAFNGQFHGSRRDVSARAR